MTGGQERQRERLRGLFAPAPVADAVAVPAAQEQVPVQSGPPAAEAPGTSAGTASWRVPQKPPVRARRRRPGEPGWEDQMRRQTFWVAREVVEALQAFSVHSGMPKWEIVDQALRSFLNRAASETKAGKGKATD